MVPKSVLFFTKEVNRYQYENSDEEAQKTGGEEEKEAEGEKEKKNEEEGPEKDLDLDLRASPENPGIYV